MRITVNGDAQTIADGTSITDLLERLGVPQAGTAVEVNATIVRRADHGATVLQDGDRVEVVRLVGGG